MEFTDIHIHALCGVDDGANTEQDMYAMLDNSYRDGVRQILLTPHFHLGYFGNNREKTHNIFDVIHTELHCKYPDLQIGLGNELRYSDGCISWLQDGLCDTLNGTEYVLIDFHSDADPKTIHRGLDRLMNAGYMPVLAHVERYPHFYRNLKELVSIKMNGVCFQMDAQSVFGAYGLAARIRCERLIKKNLVDFVGSDAHDLRGRPPGISRCYSYIKKVSGEKYAKAICCENAKKLFFDSNDK